jgi:hypothetical protein
MFNMVQEHYWTVLPYASVRHFTSLKLAPAGVVPQRERRPRPIVDYSYTYVNQHSLPVAPYHAMQYGNALPRLLQRLVYSNPAHGPPLMCKIDLSDGYYRVPLSSDASLQLAVILPPDKTAHNLIAIPLSLPMGWKESPPYFCAFTETITDAANKDLATENHQYPEHPLLTPSQKTISHKPLHFHPTAVLPLGTTDTPALAYTDVYMDDFCLLAQSPTQYRTLNTVLHNIDAVFADPPQSPRRQVISQSKIDKGDATWSSVKRLLGWDINSETMTLKIPKHRHEKLLEHIAATANTKRVSRRKWQQLLGELRSIALAIPSAKYLFSLMQHALVDQPGPRIRLNSLLKHSLADWQHLLTSLLQPVSLHHLVPVAPTSMAACDASKEGMGGFVLPLTRPSKPQAWRVPFAQEVKDLLVSQTNTSGTTNNSQLELAAIIAATAQMLTHTNTQHNTLLCALDNTPAVSWIQKGSTSTRSPAATLLRLLHHFSRDRTFTLKAIHIPGTTNNIADFLSRSFHLSDAAVLNHLHSMTKQSWTLANPPTELVSVMTSLLCSKESPAAFPLPDLPPTNKPGTFGTPFVTPSMYTPFYRTSTIPSHPSNCLPTDIGREAWLPAGLKSALEPWKRPFVPWGRRSPHWDTRTQESHHPVLSTLDCNASSPAMKDKTQPQIAKSPSPYTSSFMPPPPLWGTRPTEAKRSPTCSSSPTTFSSVQENTPSLPLPTQHHSAFDMSTSSTAIAICTGKQPHNSTGTVSPKWPLNPTDKKMESREKWLDSHHQDMSHGVQLKSSFAGSRLSANKAQPLTRPYMPIKTQQTNGQPLPQKTSQHIYAPQQWPPDTLLTLGHTKYQLDPSARPEQWPSCAQEWTQHSSNSLVGGDPPKCYATCTYNRCR